MIILIVISLGFFVVINSQGRDPRGFDRTPKALDLDDHFGSIPSENRYGPQARPQFVKLDLAREGLNPDIYTPITPITNLEQEINPLEVIAGDLDNTAPDASKIIRPPIAPPKADIRTTFIHDAIVTTPVHLGTHHTSRKIDTMNRQTGEVSHKEIFEQKPIVGMVKNLRKVETMRNTIVNINNGKIINLKKPTMLHGTEPSLT